MLVGHVKFNVEFKIPVYEKDYATINGMKDVYAIKDYNLFVKEFLEYVAVYEHNACALEIDRLIAFMNKNNGSIVITSSAPVTFKDKE